MSNKVNIFIEYRLVDSLTWESINLSPEEYFDLEEGEEISENCVPQYDHAVDYLDIEITNVSNTRIKIENFQNKTTEIITETFWNHGKNCLIESTTTNPKEVSWMIILSIQRQDNPKIWEILNFEREDDLPKLCYHGIIQDNEDGSQDEFKIYPKE